MNEQLIWLRNMIIILNLLAFCMGALFGINFERLCQKLSEKDVEKDEDL